MSHYANSASYASLPQNTFVQSGVSFVSKLKNIQNDIDTLLSQTPTFISNHAQELLEEECFDADAVLRPGFTERRLEMASVTNNATLKNIYVPKIFKTHTTEVAPTVLWETYKTNGKSEFTFRKNIIFLEDIFSDYYENISKRVFAYIKEIQEMTARIVADAARPTPIYLNREAPQSEKIVQESKKIYTAEPTPSMDYQSKKRLEFAISTATTFALFAFLLVQADFIPESPRAVLESQVAGPAFAVATNTVLAKNDPAVIENVEVAEPLPSQTVPVKENTPTTKVITPTQIPTSAKATTGTVHLTGTLPDRIIIDAINLNVPVGIPLSRDIATIDTVLLKGAALYPGSGTLDEERNLLIMGHSSHLPVVRNQAYKAFNNIETLQSGNVIRLRSGSEEYTYRVTSVRRTPAAEALVNFNTGKRQLTLVTCDNFGDKSDRYVVEADFIGKYKI